MSVFAGDELVRTLDIMKGQSTFPPVGWFQCEGISQ